MLGQSTPSARSQTQNWGAETLLPSRGTGTGWRTALRNYLWSSTRVNVESCIWGELAQDSQAMLVGWQTALWRRIGEPWGTGSWAWAFNTLSLAKQAWTPLGTALPTSHCQQCCPKGLGSLHLCRQSKPDWKWSWETCSSWPSWSCRKTAAPLQTLVLTCW